MCLYPKLIPNRKYLKNKKNKGNIPTPKDNRVLMVPVGCGKCMECKKQKARTWSIRLQEDIREYKNGKFVTLTFSNESVYELTKELTNVDGYELDNQLAILGIRRFLERWRKQYGKSLRHWLVTELGGNGTENIHLHGIIWTDEPRDTVAEIWKYGYIWPRPEKGWKENFVNDRTINYCVKYTTKVDPKHEYYNARVLASPGIGATYMKRSDSKRNKFKGTETDETYTTRQGRKMNLATYWRNKIYTEEEREELWLQKLDKQERWVDGEKVKTDTPEGIELYHKMLKYAQEKNTRLKYGNDEKDWTKELYERERRKLNTKKRLEKFANLMEDILPFEYESNTETG